MSEVSSALSTLRALVERAFPKQQVFAATWREQWNAKSRRGVSLTTVESRLSNLFADDEDGWTFFFKDPDRARLTLQLLDASEPERATIEAAAADRLSGKRHTRVCIDLHAIAGDADALLAAVEDGLLAVPGATPALVILTPEQYRRLPITYADRRDTIALERVASDAEAAALIAKCPHALVVAPVPPRDEEGRSVIERWAAMGFENDELQLEPADAVARFLAEGVLDRLPEVPEAHRLALLGVTPSPQAPALRPGPQLRELLVAVAAGRLNSTPADRLAYAAAWGVVAASTDTERVEAALAAAGVRPEDVDDATLARALDRAARRPGRGVYRVADGWHFLNVEPPGPLAGHPRVEVHTITAGPTALRRLHEVVKGWGVTAASLDPLLRDASAALDPRGEEAEAFEHARAWLLWGGLEPAAEPPCPDAPARLARLLAHAVPAAEVRYARRSPTLNEGHDEPESLVFALPPSDPLLGSVWGQTPSMGGVFWHDRSRDVVVVWPSEKRRVSDLVPRTYGWGPSAPPAQAWGGPHYVGGDALPETVPRADDPWLDAFETRGPSAPTEWVKARFTETRAAAVQARVDALLADRRFMQRRDAQEFVETELERDTPLGRTGHDQLIETAATATLADPDWSELDLKLAFGWMALRQACAVRVPVQLHDGRYILPIQPGLVAELTIVATPETLPVRAAFGRTFEIRNDDHGEHRPSWPHWTLRPERGGTALRLLASRLFTEDPLPAELHLVGEGIAVTVRFLTEPYGLAGAWAMRRD